MNKRPKIIYLITQSELGGAQENVLTLALKMKDKYDVTVAAGPDGGGKFFKRLADNNIHFQKLRWLRRSAANPIIDLLGFFEILLFLLKEQPDIVHLHSSKAGFLGSPTGKLIGAKVIYTVHGAVFEASFARTSKIIFRWLEKLSVYFKDKIICVSAKDQKLWLKYKVAPASKLTVIYNGIDADKINFLPKPEAREYLAGQSANFFEALQGTSDNLKIIGTIANFFPEKGLPYLIEAANTIINQYKAANIIFAVVGDGPERPLLEEMIKAHQLQNKFILLRTVANAARYLKAFDIFILPSVKEGFPYTILEAMAADVPIIASAVGGIPEMIADNKNGFLIVPRDTNVLADKIITLLNSSDIAAKFSQNSQKKVKEFSLDKMIAETEKIYLDQQQL